MGFIVDWVNFYYKIGNVIIKFFNGLAIVILNKVLWWGIGDFIWIKVLKVFKKKGMGMKQGKVVWILQWIVVLQ